jgi:hypothetical protein
VSAPVVIRPNGKPYRRRKPLVVSEFTDCDDSTGVVVEGTHDVDRAAALAADLLAAYDLTDSRPTRRWMRLVPWDPSGYADRAWVEDEVRGMPCVEWSW